MVHLISVFQITTDAARLNVNYSSKKNMLIHLFHFSNLT